MSKNLRSSIKGALNSSIKPGLLAPPQFRGSTLDLDFAGSKSLKNQVGRKDVVTFTRASSATYVDGDGVIQSATTNTPRFDHDPVTGESLGLLIEEARTNLLTYSEEFDQSVWSKVQGDVTPNAETAPDGTATADLFVPNTTNNFHYINQPATTVTSTTYKYSVYAKPSGYNFLLINYSGSGPVIDLSSGTVVGNFGGSTRNAIVKNVGNGWYRCSIEVIAGGTSLIIDHNVLPTSSVASYTGDGTSGVYIWGAQIEEGAFPTSYIPTTGSTVTRAADVAEITGVDSWFDTSGQQGTVFTEVATKGVSGIDAAFAIGSNADVDRWLQQYFYTSSVQYEYEQGGLPAHPYTTGTFIKSAIGRRQGDNAVGLNGAIVQTDSSSSTYTPEFLKIGVSGDVNRRLNGHIKRLAYFPVRLPDATLQNITT